MGALPYYRGMAPEKPKRKRRRKAAPRSGTDPLRVALGKVLGRWRRRHKEKLSQRQLAEKVGLSVGVLGDLERGARPIRGRELIRICHALEIPYSAVLEEIRAAQTEALRPLDEEIRRERGESVPEAEPALAAGPTSFVWEAGKQGLVFWGIAGDALSMMRAMNRFLVQNVPIAGSPEGSDPEEPPSR